MPKIKNLIILIIFFLLLCIRTFFGINFEILDEKQYSTYELNLKQGQGKILKTNGKMNFESAYLQMDKNEDGRYLLTAKLKKKSEYKGVSYYQVDSLLEKERIEEAWIKIYFKKRIKYLLKNRSIDFKNFFQGVVLGDSSYIHRDIKEKFSYAGISHLIAISGLHFGIIISILLFLLKKVPVSKNIRHILELLMLTFYALCINLSVSGMRAYIMGSMVILGGLFYEKVDIKKSLNTAFAASFLINPLYIREVSFQLSYLALFAIVYVYPKFKENIEGLKLNVKSKKIMELLILSLIIQIFLTPVFLKVFKQIPLFSFMANLVFIPLGSFVIFLCFVAFMLSNIGLGNALMPFIEIFYNLMISILELAVKIPYLSVKTEIEISYIQCFLIYMFILTVVFIPELWYSLRYKTTYRRKL